MASFTDRKGTVWHLDITVGSYKTLKRDTALDLDAIRGNPEQLALLIYGPDPMALARVMEVMLAEQVKASGLSVDEFHDRFDPATVDRAGDALFEAILTFTLRRRAEKVLPAMREMMAKVETGIVELMTGQSNNSPTSAPASLG